MRDIKLKFFISTFGLLLCVARAQAQCKGTLPLTNNPYGPIKSGEVLLFTEHGQAEAVEGHKSPSEIALDDNTFSFVDQDFCIRKGYQTCSQGTARIEFRAGKSGLLEFGVIGDERATMIPVDAEFDTVKVQNGAVVANGKVVDGLNTPLCMGPEGRASAPGTPGQSIELWDLSKTKTYVVRIVGSYFVGAKVNDMKDLILKIKVLDVSSEGVALKYTVLSNRGGNQHL